MPYIPSYASLEYQVLYRAEYLIQNPLEMTDEDYVYLNMHMEVAEDCLSYEDVSYMRHLVNQFNLQYSMMMMQRL